MKITAITARQILDSRGWPTIECSLMLDSGQLVRASVPSGASTGAHEAIELRDGDASKYAGKSVLNAIKNIETIIAPALVDAAPDIKVCDKIMLSLDGTQDKSNLGANAILAVSVAVCRAQALCRGMPVYELLSSVFNGGRKSIPEVMFNIINGGAHADGSLCFQEFMIMPTIGTRFADRLEVAVLVTHALKNLLREAGYATGTGDEGGFAPLFDAREQIPEHAALDFLMRAIEQVGFVPGTDVQICLDVAANHFYDAQEDCYRLHGGERSAADMVAFYAQLVADYPIFSIEDGLSEDDRDGWKLLTQELGEKVQLVGDDIFVTNPQRITQGIEDGIANAVLIKPNQIGTVSETIDAILLSKKNNYKTVISHRSGETNDSFIADLAVGMDAGQLKAGAPVRGERLAKYNRLLELEELI